MELILIDSGLVNKTGHHYMHAKTVCGALAWRKLRYRIFGMSGLDTSIVAAALNGEPAAGVSVTVDLHRIQWNSVRTSTGNGFYNWDTKRTPMRKEANCWKASVTLPPGRYEYRFVVDGQWISDPKAKESVNNSYGDTNSVVQV